MPYSWTEGFTENGAIVVARSVDNGFNPQAQLVNGGLCRENLPPSSILRGMVKNLAVGKWFGSNSLCNATLNVGEPFDDWSQGNDRGNDVLCGITFNDMQGGQNNVTIGSLQADCDEGMLSICFTAKCWINTFKLFFPPNPPGAAPATGSSYAEKNVRFFIRVDGATVVQTRSYYKTFENVKVETSIPISKGNHRVEVLYKFGAAASEDTMTEPQFHYWGGNLSCLNRLR